MTGKSMRLMLALSLILICSVSVHAELKGADRKLTPPIEATDEITCKPTVKKEIADSINIGDQVAFLESVFLDTIKDILGDCKIEHHGDAGASQYWISYSAPEYTVWFISHGEMGGPDHYLTQVYVQSAATRKPDEVTCGTIDPVKIPLSFDFGWIGTTRSDLIKALGQPSSDKNGILEYFYLSELVEGNDEKDEFSVMCYLKIKLKDDKVSSIYASHVTSY